MYLQTKNLRSPADELAYLKIIGGLELIDLLKNLPPSNPPGVWRFVSLIENDEYKDALSRIDDYFEQAKNPVQKRYEFRSIMQNDGERMKEFVLRLRTQANKCEFDNIEKEVMDQLITGTRDHQIRRRALMNKYPTVQEVMAEAMVNESVAAQVKSLPNATINQVKSKQAVPGPDTRRDKKSIECYNCHKLGHFAYECKNRTDGLKCFQCGKFGHPSYRCRKRREQESGPYQRPANSGRADGSKQIHNVEEGIIKKKDQTEEMVNFMGGGDAIDCKVGGVTLTLLVDSGTSSNIIDRPNWDILCSRKAVLTFQKNTDKVFKAFASSVSLPVLGYFTATLAAGGKEILAKFYVLDITARCLLGAESAKALGVLKIGMEIVSMVKRFC